MRVCVKSQAKPRDTESTRDGERERAQERMRMRMRRRRRRRKVYSKLTQ